MFAAVSDADKVPLADQIACSLGWNLVGDDGFWSNVFQNLRWTQRPGPGLWESTFASFSASSCDLGGLAHLDLLYARVPRVHLLHSEEENIVELIDVSLKDRLQPEDPPAPRHDFAIDDISVALTTAEEVQKLFQQSTNQHNTGISYQSHLPQWSPPSSRPCSPVLWWLFSELLGLFSHRRADLSFDLQLHAQALQKILLSGASSMQGTKLILILILTVISEFCRRSGGMLDPSPPLQVRDLLAYHCNGCTLKSCVAKQVKTAVMHREHRASKEKPPLFRSAGLLTCHVAEMRVRDSAAELYDSGQHTVRLQQRQRRAGGFSHFYLAGEGRCSEISREDADRASSEFCPQGHTW